MPERVLLSVCVCVDVPITGVVPAQANILYILWNVCYCRCWVFAYRGLPF